MLTVKNFLNTDGVKQGGFTVKNVIKPEKMHIDFVEVEPKETAYGYHWHEVNEEAFYIISGTGVVKTNKGNIDVKSGDLIAFPSGEDGTHVISNTSNTEKLVYLDFGRNESCEIVHFPEINKIMATGPYSSGMYDKN